MAPPFPPPPPPHTHIAPAPPQALTQSVSAPALINSIAANQLIVAQEEVEDAQVAFQPDSQMSAAMQRLVGQMDVTQVVARATQFSRRKLGSLDSKQAEADKAEHAFMMAVDEVARRAALSEPDLAVRAAIVVAEHHHPIASTSDVQHSSNWPSIGLLGINQAHAADRYDLSLEQGSLQTCIAESPRAPQGPKFGDLVRAVVVVEGAMFGFDGDFDGIAFARGDCIRVHNSDLRHSDADSQHTFVDTIAVVPFSTFEPPRAPREPDVSIVPPIGLVSVIVGPPAPEVAAEGLSPELRSLVLSEVRNALGMFASALGPAVGASEVGFDTVVSQPNVGRGIIAVIWLRGGCAATASAAAAIATTACHAATCN